MHWRESSQVQNPDKMPLLPIVLTSSLAVVETPVGITCLADITLLTLHLQIDRMGTSEECGNLIAFLLSNEAQFISGATYAIDGAWAC